MPRGPAVGSATERYQGLSHIQLRVPLDLHHAFRSLLVSRGLSVNAVAEEIISTFLDFLRQNPDYVPGERHNMTTRPLKRRGRPKREVEEETVLMS